jgi:predicted PurR-regulated permease PerM
MGDDQGMDLQEAPGVRRVWAAPLAAVFACAVALVLFLFFFSALTTIVLGLLAAAIVACTLNPLVKYIPGPRGLAAAVLGLGLIVGVSGVLAGLSWSLGSSVQRTMKDWPQRRDSIDQLLRTWSDRFELAEPVNTTDITQSVGRFFAGEQGPQFFTRSADVVVSILIWLAFIFIGSIFLLSDPAERLLHPAMITIAPRHRPHVAGMLAALGPRLRRWVIGTLLSMCIVFSASCIGYFSIGLKGLALPLALLAGMAEIVPTVGPACAILVAILFAATQSGAMVLGVLIIYAIIQSIEAYLILPMIMRGAVKIHPAVTLFSVVLWGKIFGVPGLMLAIPINLTLASAVEHLYVIPRDRGGSGKSAVGSGK